MIPDNFDQSEFSSTVQARVEARLTTAIVYDLSLEASGGRLSFVKHIQPHGGQEIPSIFVVAEWCVEGIVRYLEETKSKAWCLATNSYRWEKIGPGGKVRHQVLFYVNDASLPQAYSDEEPEHQHR